MSFLLTRPKYDEATHYLYHWAILLVEEIKRKGIALFDMEKEKVLKKPFQSYLQKKSPEVVILNGHGNTSQVAGHNNEIILDTSDDPALFRGKTFFVRACSAGRLLGPFAVKSGARAFIGYREPFKFWTNAAYIQRPLEDNFAKPFQDSSNQVPISLMKGRSAQEAHDDSIVVYKKEIAKLLNSNAENSFIVPDLIWNMVHQECLRP